MYTEMYTYNDYIERERERYVKFICIVKIFHADIYVKYTTHKT